MTEEMPKKQFEALQVTLELAMNEVDRLQALFSGQTGQDFVRPLRLKALETQGRFITEERLEELEQSDSFLDKLYAAGLDNWNGYEQAQDMED